MTKPTIRDHLDYIRIPVFEVHRGKQEMAFLMPKTTPVMCHPKYPNHKSMHGIIIDSFIEKYGVSEGEFLNKLLSEPCVTLSALSFHAAEKLPKINRQFKGIYHGVKFFTFYYLSQDLNAFVSDEVYTDRDLERDFCIDLSTYQKNKERYVKYGTFYISNFYDENETELQLYKRSL